jgi:hypothetical protein
MNVASLNFADKVISKVNELVQSLLDNVRQGAAEARSFDEVERSTLESLLEIGHTAMEGFIELQGNGDLGDEATMDGSQTLYRSEIPVGRTLHSIFGEHRFDAFVYAPGPKQKVVMRPIDARMQLPDRQQSYLYQELSQMLCVDQSFGQASRSFSTIFKQKTSVDTFENINQSMGAQAELFLDSLPTPPADEESQLLILTADGKGIPLVQEDVQKLAAVSDKPDRPGNRKMATLAGVYTVDPYVRTPEQFVEVLFKDYKEEKPPTRPKPTYKHIIGKMPTLEGEMPATSETLAIGWAADQVAARRQEGQKVIVLLDGQTSLADACADFLADVALVPEDETVFILDILHVSQYVWKAAKAFESDSEKQKAYARTRLLRILRGEAAAVIRGMRQMATARELSGTKLADVTKACGYMENNLDRMRYDEYLAAGYPIATGVIEGACRYVVKDRFERTGMRWTLEGVRPMLHLRAVHASSYWDEFHEYRKKHDAKRLYPYRDKVVALTHCVAA